MRILNRDTVMNRGKALILILALMGIIFTLRAGQIQIIDQEKFASYALSQQQSTMPLKAKRGSIFDRNGKLLAYDVESKTYALNPANITDQNDAAIKLSHITSEKAQYWKEQFQKHPGYLVVARKVLMEQQSLYENSGIPTLKGRTESTRIYPFGDLATEVIGKTGVDNYGLSGLEKFYDSQLSGIDGKSIYLRDARGREITAWEHTLVLPQNGNDIYLSIDVDFQQIVENELQRMLDSSGAKWGSAIFLDVLDGGILACATNEADEPDFPRCRSIVDVNEPGSTAKLIPLATVFQQRLYEPFDVINVEGGKYNLGGKVITDDHPFDHLQVDEIGIFSSNIGATKLGLRAGPTLIHNTLLEFGFGAKTGVDFPGEIKGAVYRPEKWTNHFLANVCFGYGITASAIQIASAYGVVASGGDLLKPYFANKLVAPDGSEKILNSKVVLRKVLDERTVKIMNDILRKVVLLGTAKKAMNDLCPVSGKTGTALRTNKGGRGYDRRRALASFAGFFPTTAPRVVGVVMFDEPRLSIYGGDISAPVLSNIARRYSSLPGNDMLAESSIDSLKAIEKILVASAGGAKAVNLAFQKPAKDEITIEKIYPLGTVPDFTGQTLRDAMREAHNLGLDCTISGSGIVVSQSPEPGTVIDSVSIVVLVGEAE